MVSRFFSVHTITGTEEEVKRLTRDMPPQLPSGISWKLIRYDFAGNKFFCEWEAPNKEAIEQIFKAANLPFDAVYPVRLLDIAKVELEA